MEIDAAPIRLFVGAHKSEALPTRVLDYSIRRHASLPVTLQTVDNSLAPAPADQRFLPYTHFSYGRFAIPKLCNYSGRAIYLDSDMLVLRDIAELWQTPFEGAKILVEQISRPAREKGRSTAVMLLDCTRLPWQPDEIIARLGHDYDYDQLMSIEPLLEPGALRAGLAEGWNSLDHLGPETRLLHFTKIKTQPWVYAGHPLGQHWSGELKRMLGDGSIDAAFVRAEVDRGHVRPSLLIELGLQSGADNNPVSLDRYDKQRGYSIHKELFAAMERRRLALLQRDQELDPVGYRRRRQRRRLRSFAKHPIQFLLDPSRRA